MGTFCARLCNNYHIINIAHYESAAGRRARVWTTGSKTVMSRKNSPKLEKCPIQLVL